MNSSRNRYSELSPWVSPRQMLPKPDPRMISRSLEVQPLRKPVRVRLLASRGPGMTRTIDRSTIDHTIQRKQLSFSNYEMADLSEEKKSRDFPRGRIRLQRQRELFRPTLYPYREQVEHPLRLFRPRVSRQVGVINRLTIIEKQR